MGNDRLISTKDLISREKILEPPPRLKSESETAYLAFVEWCRGLGPPDIAKKINIKLSSVHVYKHRYGWDRRVSNYVLPDIDAKTEIEAVEHIKAVHKSKVEELKSIIFDVAIVFAQKLKDAAPMIGVNNMNDFNKGTAALNSLVASARDADLIGTPQEIQDAGNPLAGMVQLNFGAVLPPGASFAPGALQDIEAEARPVASPEASPGNGHGNGSHATSSLPLPLSQTEGG